MGQQDSDQGGAYSPDGKHIVGGQLKQVVTTLWDAETGQLVRTL